MLKKLILISVAAALLLSGCMISLVSMDSRLTLTADEKWDMQIDVVLPGDVAQAYGADLVSQIGESVQELEDQGVSVDYELSDADRVGNITLKVRFRGQGYELFNEVLGTSGSISTEQQGNKKLVHVYIVDIASGISVTNGSTYTVKGGRILSTNGNQVNATTAEWFNGTAIEVTMEEPGAGVSGLGIALIVLGVLFVAFAIGWRMGWFKRRAQPQPSAAADWSPQDFTVAPVTQSNPPPSAVAPIATPAPPTQAARFCSHCGASLSAQARFCNKCGKQVG